jgi:RNA polymerase sigma-70 factor, ECF subfamily
VSAASTVKAIAQEGPSPIDSATESSETGALVLQARDGSRPAFGRLYEAHARMVHGILLARVPWIEVDDLVQEVFLLALKQLHRLRKPAAFGGWLAQIARNRATDFHRRARPARALPSGEGESNAKAGTISTGNPDYASQAEAEAALTAIRALPEAYRETLVLRLVEGMTGPEIAARTGLTPASVRVNLHRGMKLLREALGRAANHE